MDPPALPSETAFTIAVLDPFTRSTATIGWAIPAVATLAAASLVLRTAVAHRKPRYYPI